MRIIIIIVLLLLVACTDQMQGWGINRAVAICGGSDKIQELIYTPNSGYTVICIDGSSANYNLQKLVERAN